MTKLFKEFIHHENQMCSLGKHSWNVSRLHQLTKDFPVMDVPLTHIGMYHTYDKLSLRQMVSHMDAVNRADLSYPIILDEDGDLMDGRHRIMKAILNQEETIKVVRFIENPKPCGYED